MLGPTFDFTHPTAAATLAARLTNAGTARATRLRSGSGHADGDPVGREVVVPERPEDRPGSDPTGTAC